MQKISLANFEYSRVLTWVVSFCLLTSCGHSSKTATVKDVRRSISTIYQAIEYGLPGGVFKRSRNNRVFFGHYHPPRGNPNVDARRKINRAQAVVYIMNEKRPYDVVIDYRVERYSGGSYSVIDRDQSHAEKIKRKIQDYLVSRPDKRSMIDDFRAF